MTDHVCANCPKGLSARCPFFVLSCTTAFRNECRALSPEPRRGRHRPCCSSSACPLTKTGIDGQGRCLYDPQFRREPRRFAKLHRLNSDHARQTLLSAHVTVLHYNQQRTSSLISCSRPSITECVVYRVRIVAVTNMRLWRHSPQRIAIAYLPSIRMTRYAGVRKTDTQRQRSPTRQAKRRKAMCEAEQDNVKRIASFPAITAAGPLPMTARFGPAPSRLTRFSLACHQAGSIFHVFPLTDLGALQQERHGKLIMQFQFSQQARTSGLHPPLTHQRLPRVVGRAV